MDARDEDSAMRRTAGIAGGKGKGSRFQQPEAFAGAWLFGWKPTKEGEPVSAPTRIHTLDSDGDPDEETENDLLMVIPCHGSWEGESRDQP